MAASLAVVSCRVTVEVCKGGCEDRTRAREDKESPLLEAVARERLMKTQQAGKRLSGCCGNLCRLAIALYLPVFPSRVYKWSINPFTNPYPVYSHTSINRDNMNYAPRSWPSLQTYFFKSVSHFILSNFIIWFVVIKTQRIYGWQQDIQSVLALTVCRVTSLCCLQPQNRPWLLLFYIIFTTTAS
jgi:hypothetical protein